MFKIKKLKIGIFMDSFFPNVDGVVMVIDNLAKCMSKFAEVTVVVPYNESVVEDENRPYRVIRIKSIHLPTTEYRVALPVAKHSKVFQKLLHEKFDVIHIHSPFTIGKLGIRVARELNVPVIATMHTRFDFEFRKYMKSELFVKLAIRVIIKVFNQCDRGISVNKAIGRVFKEYGYKEEPLAMYNGTDMKIVQDGQEAIQKVNQLYRIEQNENVFLFVGRITEIKNIFFILDVLKILKEKEQKFKMLYVGTGPDEEKLKRKVLEMKLDKEVILCGKIMDRELLKSIYYRANLFLFPSLFDASSLVQIEAASQKTPGIFIEGAITADTITNNENGYTAPNDAIQFANRVVEILENKELYHVVCENAHNQLAKSWEEIAKETCELYQQEIIKKQKGM
ncbi:MAG: glycosyltransferase [Clostridia bacterium]|nr:glycosyltransferase [Clostridia bacterium]